MVIIHIANIDTAVIGGVQIAVPQMISAQSQYATVGFVNTHGDNLDNVHMLPYNGTFDISQYPKPFDKPDIVVFHELYRFEYIEIYRALVDSKIPYIIVPHGSFSKKAQRKKFLKKFAANLLFFNKFINSASSIQYLSNNENRMSAFSRQRSFVAGNGVSVPVKRKITFSNDGIRFVYIGRLETRIKGLDLLLKAIKKCEILLRQSHAIFEIYGPDYGGSHKQILRMINKLKIEDLVHLDKEKRGLEKEGILLSADCFIQTSRTEGMPMGILEALSYGIPCIVTTGTSLGEIIEKYQAGWVASTTVREIAEATNRAAEERDSWMLKSQQAKKLILENYTQEKTAKEAIVQYMKIIGRL